ncbi:type I restriction endonuclease subunit R [Mobilicoccus massiliensis]|uniref:type I restriction endonuclease subunit R n=1 Tax=Mobilicoccus massiliensis TaxID=1522310 RepID=UPI00058C55AE|nr:type I restriction endonuclease subunit R [Mobilicoccus massiliensis]
MGRAGSEAMWEDMAMNVLAELQWTPLKGEQIAPGTGERESWKDLVIPSRVAAALTRLNPDVPQTYLQQAQAEILRPRSNDALAENYRLHEVLTQGYHGVTYLDSAGVERTPTIRLMSTTVDDNDWLAVNQVTIRDGEHHRRFDVVLYSNGLPVAIVELKRSGDSKASSAGAHAQLELYLREFPMVFRTVLLTVASDGATAQYGTPFTPYEHFSPWNVDDDGTVVRAGEAFGDEEYTTPLGVLLHGLFNQERFGQLMRGYTAFSERDGVLTKRIAKPHQYFAVTAAVGSTVEAIRSDGRAGVVWHTQGSGKSMEMELYAAAVHRTPELANPTIVVVTDRRELDGQLFQTFRDSRLLPEAPVQIATRAQLRAELTGRRTGGIYFTTLQKFGLSKAEKDAGATHPELTDRRNVLVVVDEAHRSHYDDLDGYAAHLRHALPGASFIAFTGTPISFTERDTRATFGGYVDVYDLTRAVEDGATVPVYFEPRLIPLARMEEATEEDIDRAADEATEGLDTLERAKVEKSVAVINELYGHPDRIRTLAADLLEHWDRRKTAMLPQIETGGKAMIVCATREIAARLYDEIVAQRRAAGDDTWHSDAIERGKVKVVYSGTTTDPDPISHHVRRGHEQQTIQSRIKKPDDELELVIVKDMLLTGFDAPSLHTLYVDRPLKGALLMQTLARVNRTYRGKDNGLLVGYAPLADNLEAALAEYSDTDRREKPQGRHADEAVGLALDLLAQLDALLPFDRSEEMKKHPAQVAYLRTVIAAANRLVSPECRSTADLGGGEADEDQPESTYARYRRLVGQLNRAWAIGGGGETLAAKRDDFRFHSEVRVYLAKLEAGERRASGKPVPEDIARLLRSLIVDTTTPGEVVDIYAVAGIERPDLGRLTPGAIEALRRTPAPNLAIEALRSALTEDSHAVTGGNLSRERQFSERLAALMNRYVNSQLTAAEVIEELLRVASDIAAEARRGEQFTPPLHRDELAFFDAVSQNDSAVLLQGEDTLAQIARELVAIMRRDVKTDWTVREDVRAKLRVSVKRLLVKYDYPPDKQPEAIRLVIEQMEALAPKYVEGDER